jgi:hypothetical protein
MLMRNSNFANHPTHANSDDIFGILNGFVKESNTDWSKCVRISNDSGIVAYVRTGSPQAKFFQCCHPQVITRNT